MNNDNLVFLQDNLKYMGFGDLLLLNEQLEQEIIRETKEFQLSTEAYYEDNYRLEGILYFRRGDSSDLYFFNKYEALLRDGSNENNTRRQVFYISKGTGVTFREAFNLLQGRSVNRDFTDFEGEKYNAWIQLNFEELDTHQNHKVKQFRVQYGYNLEKILENYPIRELTSPETKSGLLKSLKKGNLQQVSFCMSDRTEKMLIEAAPQFKTIHIYKSSAQGLQRVERKEMLAFMAERVMQKTAEPPEDWKDMETAEVEEVKEEEQETVISRPAAKRGSRK